jgi:hypothetical protein
MTVRVVNMQGGLHPQTSFSDSFNRIDTVRNLGGEWLTFNRTVLQNGGSGTTPNVRIFTNAAQLFPDGNIVGGNNTGSMFVPMRICNPFVSGHNQFAEGVFKTFAHPFANIGLAVAMQPYYGSQLQTGYYMSLEDATHLGIRKITIGNPGSQTLLTAATLFTPTANDTWRIECKFTSTTTQIAVGINGVLAVQVTDAAIPSLLGWPGFGLGAIVTTAGGGPETLEFDSFRCGLGNILI